MKVVIGLLWFAIIIGNGLAFATRERRSGRVQNYGHPAKDNVLLLVSGIVLVGVMVAGIWRMGRGDMESARYVFLLPFLAVAAGLTWLANRALKR